MRPAPVWPRVLRGLAVTIAVVAVIDPAVTTARRTDATVAVIAGRAPADSSLARRVADELDDAFTVVRGPFTAAAASVVVGDRLPHNAHALAAPVFALLPEAGDRSVRLRRIDAPEAAPLNTRMPIDIIASTSGGAGRELAVSLRSGDAVLDRAVYDVATDDEWVHASLSYVPRGAGTRALHVHAELDGVQSVQRGLVIDVNERRLPILFHDGRPGWLSAFVRRALEQDARFSVMSRVATSRGVATLSGQPPGGLSDAAAVDGFDAIVIGAPETLSAAEVAGLERYLRRRGGTVVLLLDRPAGGAYERLAGVTSWTHAEPETPVDVTVAAGVMAGARLRALELIRPQRLPAGAVTIAGAGADGDVPVIWQSAVGAGRLVVGGAADAWRYRDTELSDFDAFWRTLVADLAAASPAPVELHVGGPGARAAVTPGEAVRLELTARDAALAAVAPGDSAVVRVSATSDASADGETVRFWPDVARGRFTAQLRVPDAAGGYDVTASVNGETVRTTVVVSEDDGGGADDRDVVRAWTTSRGGDAVDAARLDVLADMLRGTIAAERRRESWHPMRSAWWIVPFVALLGAEWLWRRKRGLP